MKKWSKFILAILLIAVLMSAFTACKLKKEELSLTFVSDEKQYATTIGIDEAKSILESQPSRDGYVFKGWYLDKGTWTQKVEVDNIEDISKDNKSIEVYAYWVEIVNKITVLFRDYTEAILLEKDYERSDNELAKDLASLRPSKRPDDEKYTYTFDKWLCDTSDLTASYYVATPEYKSELRKFALNYYVDEELVFTDYVKYGESADRNLVADPQKASTEKYDYVFTGWSGNFDNITQDTDVYANFTKTVKKFDVTFNFGNDKSKTVKVEYGKTATPPNESEIVKPSTAQYSYTFVGWDNSFENIKQNTVVNAKYVSQLRTFDVKFFVDDDCIKSVNVPYGSKVVAPSQPVKTANDGFTYEFAGWDRNFDNIVENTVVNAVFNKIANVYTIQYVNWDGELLYTDSVESGQSSTYGGEAPTRKSNDKFDYIFTGWSDEDKLNPVTRNITVQAKFTPQIKTFSVTFKYGDDKKTVWPEIEYGTDLTNSNLVPTEVAKSPTAQYEYKFIGWDGTFNNITEDTVINARYFQSVRSYEVKFFADDVCIKSVSVLYGSSVEAPTQPVKVKDDGFTYEFSHWDNDFDNIVDDTVVNAVFNKISHTYTIQYVNWDGELLYTDSVESAGKSTYVGDTPTREANDKHTYEFIGWSNQDALDNVTRSFATQAQFEEVIRTYTVTFNYGNGLQEVIENVPYGTNLSKDETFSSKIPSDTDKTSTKKYDFTFIDWDKYFGYVSSDMEINAIYKETIRRYIVKFINNGVAIFTQEVEYGECPTLPTTVTLLNDTVKWAFDFLGWKVLDVDTTQAGEESDIDSDDGTDYRYTVENADGYELSDPQNSMVEGEITYTAMYLRTIQKYIIKFFKEENDLEAFKEIEVPWGTNVIADNLAPEATKESTPKWEYTFTNWSRDLTKVEANISVYAQFLANIRSYWIRYYNEGELVEEFYAEYDSVIPRTGVIPTKVSTLEFDFEFDDWDKAADRRVEGELAINAVYKHNLRSYVVTLFNLATHELISTGEFAYGTKITTTINPNGYDFDSWYRDPDCNTVFNQEEECVDGPMMLFGNVVMQGFEFNENNEIIGYKGSTANVVIPMAANGRKVSVIKTNAFKDNEVIESVYIPNTITKVEDFAFANVDIAEKGSIYIQGTKGNLSTKPSGWATEWNWNSRTSSNIKIVSLTKSYDMRPAVYGVEGVYALGNYQYMLFADGTAYIDKFINNTASTAYMDAEFTSELASFVSTKWKDVGKTEEERDIYTIEREEKSYSIKQISGSAFEGSKNLTTIFIPSTIEKVGNYAFSGVSANIYIAKKKPALESSAWSLTGTSNWNKNRDGQEGERTLYWDVIALDTVGDFNFIFKTGNVAIAAEYLGSSLATSVDVPGSITYNEEQYTVEELGAELLTNMTLLNTVNIGEGIKKIGKKAFYMDVALKNVNLPSTLEEISEQAFMACMALNEIYIPASVTKIGSLTFIGIDNLTIYCGNKKTLGLAPVGYIVGWNTKLGFSDLGKLTDISGILGSVTQTHEVIWEVAGLPQTQSVGTALPGKYTYLLYNDGHAELIASDVPLGSTHTSYTIPEAINFNGTDYAVTKITASAFAGNTRIKELIIPTSVTTIEANAFQGCSNLTIKTAHTSKPSGWDSNFNPDGRQVEYSYGVSTVTETEFTEEVA